MCVQSIVNKHFKILLKKFQIPSLKKIIPTIPATAPSTVLSVDFCIVTMVGFPVV